MRSWLIEKLNAVPREEYDLEVASRQGLQRMAKESRDKLTSDKGYSLDNFREYLEKNVKSTIIQYDGGRGKPKAAHEFLAIDKETKELYSEFVNELLYPFCMNSPDDIIFALNLEINKLIEPVRKYRTDFKAWGKHEYWESAEELFDILVMQAKGLDCESIAFFKYHCFKTALENFRRCWDLFALNVKWRLRLLFVNVIGIGYHVLLGWVKEGPNDWLPVESTIHPDQFERIWHNNMLLKNNYFYEIMWSFDDEKEYKRLI